jgi:hypothetical protein
VPPQAPLVAPPAAPALLSRESRPAAPPASPSPSREWRSAAPPGEPRRWEELCLGRAAVGVEVKDRRIYRGAE